MKNLMVILLLLGAKFASADIVVKHDTANGYYYCDISPVVCQVGKDTTTRLSCVLFNDNNINKAVIAYALRNDDGITQCYGNITLCDSNYTAFRELCEDTDSLLKVKFLYNFISDRIPQIQPVD